MIICKSELCVYNKDGKCTADDILIDGCGECMTSDYKEQKHETIIPNIQNNTHTDNQSVFMGC